MERPMNAGHEDRTSTRVAKAMVLGTMILLPLTLITLDLGSHYRISNSSQLYMRFVLVHDFPVLWVMLLLMGIAGGVFFTRSQVDLARLPIAIDAHPRSVCLIAVAVIGVMHFIAYRNWPLSMDEYCYLAQAELFASGHLTGFVPPEIREWTWWPGFIGHFIRVSASGELTTAYWPGYSLLMAPLVWLGSPWLLNTMLAGGAIVAVRRICHAIFPGKNAVAGWAVLFTVASPVFFANAISYYYHMATLFFNLCFVLLVLEPTPRRLAAAGLLGGYACLLANPAPHFCFAVPWIVAIVLGKRGIRNLLLLGLGYLPGIVFFLAWHFWVLSFDDRRGEEPYTSNSILAIIFSLSGKTLVYRTLAIVKMWSWAAPGLLVLALFGWLRLRKENRVCNLLGWSCIFTFTFFLFISFSQGHGWGFRYMFGAWAAFPILAAAAMGRFEGKEYRKVTSFVALVALMSIAILLPLRFVQIGRFISDHLAQRPDGISGTGDPEIVFIDPDGICSTDLVQNDLLLRNSPLYLSSRGPLENREFMAAHFPNFRPADSPIEAVWEYRDVDARNPSPIESYWFSQLKYGVARDGDRP